MANITRFDPFNDLVDDLFKGFLVRPMLYEGTQSAGLPRVKLDVTERNGAYLVSADLPGVKKEDIQVAIDGAQVTLTAEVKREKESPRASAYCIPNASSARCRAASRCRRNWTRRRRRRNSATACSN